MTLAEAWTALYARKVPIALFTVACAAVAAGGSFLIRPVFRAEALISPVGGGSGNAISSLASQFGGLAELAGVSLSQGGNKSASLATLKSRSLSESFIKDKNLLPLIFENDWDAAANRWKSDDPKKIPTVSDAYTLFDKSIRSIQEDRKTGLVTVAIEWHDAATAAAWANELVLRANQRLQQETVDEGQKTIAYLTDQVAKAGTVEVRQALYNLIEIETKNVAVAHAREEFAFKVIDPAEPPNKRSKPNRRQMTLAGLMLGLVASSLWALLDHVGALGGRKH